MAYKSEKKYLTANYRYDALWVKNHSVKKSSEIFANLITAKSPYDQIMCKEPNLISIIWLCFTCALYSSENKQLQIKSNLMLARHSIQSYPTYSFYILSNQPSMQASCRINTLMDKTTWVQIMLFVQNLVHFMQL